MRLHSVSREIEVIESRGIESSKRVGSGAGRWDDSSGGRYGNRSDTSVTSKYGPAKIRRGERVLKAKIYVLLWKTQFPR